MKSSGIFHSVNLCPLTDASEEQTASIFRVSSARKSFWTANVPEELAREQLALRKTSLEKLKNLRKLIERSIPVLTF
jgi:hypothetical protein